MLLFKRYRSIDWRHVARRVGSEIWEDDVFGRAAQFSYFLVFSLIPVLLIVTVILGYLAQANETRQTLLQYLGQIIPGSSFALVRSSLEQIMKHASRGKLWIGVLTTLWAASSGMSAIIDGMNKAYEVHDTRPWWKSRLLAVVLTLALSALIIIALMILLYGPQFAELLANWLGFGPAFSWVWKVLRWPLVILFALLAFWIVYRFAPNLHHQKWWWIGPGCVIGVFLWILVSFGLHVYLRYFTAYSTIYGSLGAALILLLWLYFSSACLLIGAELNSEIENAAAESGVADAKRPGEKQPSGAG